MAGLITSHFTYLFHDYQCHITPHHKPLSYWNWIWISFCICSQLFKLITNSSSLNKGNYDCDSVWISDLNINIDSYNFIFNLHFLLTFDFCWLRRYLKHSRQCLTTFANTSKFVKNTLLRIIFSTLLSVLGCGWTGSFVFDILLQASPSSAMMTRAVASTRPTKALASLISFAFVIYSHHKHS